MDDELLPIGRFARAAGMTVRALRHYAAEGVLVPASIDPATGYRRYRREQLATARAIAALRALEVSLPAIRDLLRSDDPAVRVSILAAERSRLEARTTHLQRALHRLSMLQVDRDPSPRSQEETAMPAPRRVPQLPGDVHRELAAGLFNRTWELLELEDRTTAQDDELVHTAHASAWHWLQVGTQANRARAEWLCSRVYAVLRRPEESVHHARRCVDLVEAGGDGLEDWDAAAAAEAMARALAISGDRAGAASWKARAAEILASVPPGEDRSIIEGDLATVPA